MSAKRPLKVGDEVSVESVFSLEECPFCDEAGYVYVPTWDPDGGGMLAVKCGHNVKPFLSSEG